MIIRMDALILAFVVMAKLSYYDPATCHVRPINCFDPNRWWQMSNGHDARDWYGRALACPAEYPIGTRFTIEGSRWGLADGQYRCLDRGGMVVTGADGVIVLDLLLDYPIWADTLPVTVEMKMPEWLSESRVR